MKNLISSIILAILMIGCTDDGASLLDKAESGDLNEERVFESAKYTEEFLTGIYIKVPQGWNNNVYLDACTDDGESRAWWGWCNELHTGSYNATSMPDKLKKWADFYSAIRACNLFLSKIDNVTPDPEQNISTDSVRNVRKYEALCLRAFFYAELVRYYGSVPLITKVLDLDSPELYSPRASLQELKDFVLEQCEIAAANLPDKQTGTNYPRWTSGVAKAVKARFLLLLASPLLNNDKDAFGNTTQACPWSWGSYDPERWKEAADAAKAVIEHTGRTGAPIYKLVTFSQDNYFGTQASYPGSPDALGFYRVFILRVNDEVLTNWPYKGNTNELEKWQLPGQIQNNGDKAYTMPTYNYAACFQTKDGIDPYLTDDYGQPLIDENGEFKVNPLSGFNPQAPYDNRDSRFYHSIFYQGSRFGNLTIELWRKEDGSKGRDYQSGYAMTGLFLRKALDPKNISIQAGKADGVNGQTSHSFPIFRLVEFLLGYAEAQNEYLPDGTDRSEVIEQLDKIRSRSAMPDVRTTFQRNGWDVNNQQQMRKFIRNERRIELAFEEHRFFDVKRWMIGQKTQTNIYAHDVIKNNDDSFTYKVIPWEKRLFQAKDHFLPIPQGEINNNPNLLQNPGW